MKKVLVMIGVVAVILAFGATPIPAADEVAPAPAAAVAPPAEEKPKIFVVGAKTENLLVKDDAGKQVDIVKLAAGSKSMLVFMNTACSACLGELGMANTLLNRFPKSQLFVVASDFGPFDKIAAYKEKYKFGGTWVQDEDFLIAPKFGMSYTPGMVVLDVDGSVLFSQGGFMKSTAKKTEDAVAAALRK